MNNGTMLSDENVAPAGALNKGTSAGQRRPLSNVDINSRTTLTRSQAKAQALAEKNLPSQPAVAQNQQVRPVTRRSGLGSQDGPLTRSRGVPAATGVAVKPPAPATRPAGASLSNLLQTRSQESARPTRRSVQSLEPPQSPLPDIDACDRENYLYETEYVLDIYDYYRRVEDRYCVQPYMSNQPDINDKMRAILIDWLVEVHLKFRLMPETLFLTVQIIDRYLSTNTTSRKNLQLVGVTAMLIASKYEEIWAPEVRDFVFICDNAYKHAEILAMEKEMLNKLQFKVTSPTSYHFLARFIKACAPKTEKRFNMLCMYAIEVSFPEYSMMGHSYSKIAAASVLLAREVFQSGPWTRVLERHTGYAASELTELAENMKAAMRKASQPDASLKAVFKKYSNTRFHQAAQLV